MGSGTPPAPACDGGLARPFRRGRLGVDSQGGCVSGVVLGMLRRVLIHRSGEGSPRPRPRALFGAARLAALVAMLLSAQAASAKPTAEGFALNRYAPAPAGSDWFAGDSLDLRGHQRLGFGVIADFATNPLVILGTATSPNIPIVSSQFFYHLTFGLVLADRLRLAVELPVLLNNGGGAGVVGEVAGVPNVLLSSDSGGGLGDPALGLDVRLAGAFGEPFTLALGGRFFPPLGPERRFVGDGLGRLDLRVKAAGSTARFGYAAHLGVMLRAEQDDFADVPFGNDLLFGVSAGLRLVGGRLTLGPELYGRTVISDSGSGFLQEVTTPIEAVLGAKYRFPFGLSIGLAAGTGLSAGLGAADARALAAVEWASPFGSTGDAQSVLRRPASDTDGDGIADAYDACPTAAGPTLPLEPDQTGCPDGDFDGIVDSLDACPAQAGPPDSRPEKNGCRALPDGDGDGVFDEVDACADQVGVRQQNPKFNGCPLDSDGDGVHDAEDACPHQSVVRGQGARAPGCPRAYIQEGRIASEDTIQFAPSSSRILPSSDTVLEELAALLRSHPDIRLVAVEGHTDSVGDPRVNYRLSRSRAAAVAQALVARGVAAARLVPEGFGDTRPVAPNDTREGRNANRRVELNILRRTEARP